MRAAKQICLMRSNYYLQYPQGMELHQVSIVMIFSIDEPI